MARYLVTGGAGFIGSHLVDSLTAESHRVRVLDDLSSGKSKNLPPGVELVISDITDPEAVREGLHDVDGCFHLAAIASVERGTQEWLRSHSVNLSGTITVFDEARRRQRISEKSLPIVYASSAAVYGDPNQVPISEQALTRPMSAYGADKLGCDLHAAVAARVFNMSTVGLRFFNIYGPRQDPRSPYSGVISIFCAQMLEKLPLEVHGDGGQTRDFVYVEDAVRALRRAMELASHEQSSRVFNICSGIGTTIRELAKVISELNGIPFSPRYAPARPGDVRISLGDPRLAREQLGFDTRFSLRQGLKHTLHWMADGKTDMT